MHQNNKNGSSTSKVEGLTTKSAFFVISETLLTQDVLSYVSSKYSLQYGRSRLNVIGIKSVFQVVSNISIIKIISVFKDGVHELRRDVVCQLQELFE